MTDKAAAAIMEIAEKTFPLFGSRLDEWRKVEQDKLISGLTTLISEHYVSKEDINQEVEKRIAERMLTDEDIIDFALLYVSHKSLLPANRGLIKDAIIIGMKELRSRLTNPGDSQKMEGGEG